MAGKKRERHYAWQWRDKDGRVEGYHHCRASSRAEAIRIGNEMGKGSEHRQTLVVAEETLCAGKAADKFERVMDERYRGMFD